MTNKRTIMVRCPGEGCHNLIPQGFKDCGAHPELRKLRALEVQREYRKRMKEDLTPPAPPPQKLTYPRARDMTDKEQAAFAKERKKEAVQLEEFRARINPELLAMRKMRGAMI